MVKWVRLADVLATDEVLAVRGVLGDGCRDRVPVPGAPGVGREVAAFVADTLLENLEPLARPVVGRHVVARGPGHVHQAGAYTRQILYPGRLRGSQRRVLTRVLHGTANAQLEGDLVAGTDGQDLGAARVGEGALVADYVLPVDGGVVADVLRGVGRELDRVVHGLARGLPDVLEGRRLAAGAGVGDLEEVVGGSALRDGAEDEGGSLHGDDML